MLFMHLCIYAVIRLFINVSVYYFFFMPLSIFSIINFCIYLLMFFIIICACMYLFMHLHIYPYIYECINYLDMWNYI